MGLISHGGENLLDFLELRQVLSTYDEDLRHPLWWPQERPVPMRVALGALGIPLPSMPGLRPFVESLPEPEDSSPVLTWTLGYFWCLPRGVSPPLSGACTCGFLPSCSSSVTLPWRGSKDQWLSLEPFPRGFPTGLSHVPPRCESILPLKVEAVQGKQVSLEWTEVSGGLWEWWHYPGVPLAFPVESASS